MGELTGTFVKENAAQATLAALLNRYKLKISVKSSALAAASRPSSTKSRLLRPHYTKPQPPS